MVNGPLGHSVKGTLKDLCYNEIIGELRIPPYRLLSPLLAPISRRRRVPQKATYLK